MERKDVFKRLVVGLVIGFISALIVTVTTGLPQNHIVGIYFFVSVFFALIFGAVIGLTFGVIDSWVMGGVITGSCIGCGILVGSFLTLMTLSFII